MSRDSRKRATKSRTGDFGKRYDRTYSSPLTTTATPCPRCSSSVKAIYHAGSCPRMPVQATDPIIRK